jgi:hypothetical protein
MEWIWHGTLWEPKALKLPYFDAANVDQTDVPMRFSTQGCIVVALHMPSPAAVKH